MLFQHRWSPGWEQRAVTDSVLLQCRDLGLVQWVQVTGKHVGMCPPLDKRPNSPAARPLPPPDPCSWPFSPSASAPATMSTLQTSSTLRPSHGPQFSHPDTRVAPSLPALKILLLHPLFILPTFPEMPGGQCLPPAAEEAAEGHKDRSHTRRGRGPLTWYVCFSTTERPKWWSQTTERALPSSRMT